MKIQIVCYVLSLDEATLVKCWQTWSGILTQSCDAQYFIKKKVWISWALPDRWKCTVPEPAGFQIQRPLISLSTALAKAKGKIFLFPNARKKITSKCTAPADWTSSSLKKREVWISEFYFTNCWSGSTHTDVDH